ncbi:MAG: methyl-accepting chemotaxis protein [Firmicutes bacterium]|nr:methyl-accepting chemotaxis protein [Bacillota bacterium]
MKSIRARIMLLFGVSMTLLLSLLGVLLYLDLTRTVIPLTEDMSEQIVEARSQEVSNWLNGHVDQVRLVATQDIFRKWDIPAMERYLDQHRQFLNPVHEMIFFADTTGQYYTTGGHRGSIGHRDYFKEIMKGNRDYVISSAMISNSTSNPIITIAHAVKDDYGRIKGIAAATVELNTLSQIATNIKLARTGYGFIIDDTGLVIAHPDQSVAMNFNMLKGDEQGYKGLTDVAKALTQGQKGIKRVAQPDGSESINIYTPIPGTDGFGLGVAVPTQELLETAHDVVRHTVLLLLVVGVLMLSVAYFLAQSISRPVVRLATDIETVAGGDLTVQVDVKNKDELGRMANAFNRMGEGLNSMIREIKEVAEQTSASSQQLSAASEESAAASEEVAATTGQLANAVEQVANSAEDMAKEAESIKDLSDKGREQMLLTSQSMEGIQQSADQSRQVIYGLAEAINQINSIVNLISDVAEQTNLLALNAAIEAARAGEYGRGFAVVADEVRKLAEMTQGSIVNIRGIVDAISDETRQALAVFDASNVEIDKGVEGLSQTQAAFDDIIERIDAVVPLINQVARASQEVREGSMGIAASSQEQSASMEEIASTAQSLASLSETLQSLIAVFKV